MLTIGEGTYGTIKVRGRGEVVVGKYCSIAANVTAFLPPGHRTDWITTYPFPVFYELPIKGHPTDPARISIGNDVWIGRNTILIEGAEVGDGAVIGSFSVVAGSVDSYSVVVGNPARRVRSRFPDEIIAGLLKVAWWDWPKEKILENAELLCSRRVEEFLAKY
jgi:acetyltransferase-like isoleucine patch superfamily enzyme